MSYAKAGRAIAALVLISAFSSSLHAQASRRDGFWFSGGLGGGSLGCENCGSRTGGGVVDLALGGTINTHVLLGVGTAGWSREERGVRLTAATLDARVRVYPSVTNGFFLTAGLGLGSLRGEFGVFGSETQTGTSALLGLGYDIAVGKRVSLTPFANGVGVKTQDSDANFGQFGLAIVFH